MKAQLIFLSVICTVVIALIHAPAAQGAQPQKFKTVDSNTDNNSNSSSTRDLDYFKGEPFPQTNSLFLGLGLNYFNSFGIQARYATRIVDKGFIPDINNSFYIEGGFGLTFYGTQGTQSGITGLNVIATGRWDFQFIPEATFFADLGLGFNGVSNNAASQVSGANLFPAFGVGAMFNFTSEWAARADLSYQFFGAGLLHRF